MKKVGFIDYYLDEWHANHYPEFIKKQSDGRYEVCYAYARIDSPNGGMTSEEWSKKYNVELLKTIEEVVEKSDVIVVLSPDNPEMHLELTDIPLKSGKPVYIDKTFAPDKETAIKIFDNAVSNNAKCFSSSALRFVTETKGIDTDKICKIYSEGPGKYDTYSIHQIEPIMSLMKCRAKRVMALSDEAHPSLVIEFEDGRLAQMIQHKNADFRLTVCYGDNKAEVHTIKSDYFALFIDAMLEFFDTGVVPVPKEQTIDVIAVIGAGHKAFSTPFVWVNV